MEQKGNAGHDHAVDALAGRDHAGHDHEVEGHDHAGHDDAGHDLAGHNHASDEHAGHDHAGHDHSSDKHAGHDHTGHDHASQSNAGHSHAGHDHAGHSHAGHNHLHGVTDLRRIGWAFVIIALFMVVEVAGGVISGSLALIADAGHMVSDAAALGFSWLAIHMGRKAATTEMSYGYKRLEILAAFVNGLALFVIAGWIIYEAIRRFAAPVEVMGTPMLIVATIGLLANIAAFFVLNGGNHDNLNMRSAWLHVLGDLLGSAVAIVAALVILFTGWTPIDPILSILVAVIVLKSAWQIVKSSGHILLEGTPPGLNPLAIKQEIEARIPQVKDVHHIHAWSMTAEQHMVTMHVVPRDQASAQAVLTAVRALLTERFSVSHVTVQIEEEVCAEEDADGIGCAHLTH